MQERVNNPEDRLEDFKQKSMECDFEIWGIDKTLDENLNAIVLEFFSSFEVNVSEGYISKTKL